MNVVRSSGQPDLIYILLSEREAVELLEDKSLPKKIRKRLKKVVLSGS